MTWVSTTITYYAAYTKAVFKAPLLIMYGKPVCMSAPFFVILETTEAYGFTGVCIVIVCGLIFSRNHLLSVFKLAVSKVTSEDSSRSADANKVHSLGLLSSSFSFFKKSISATTAHLTRQIWRK